MRMVGIMRLARMMGLVGWGDGPVRMAGMGLVGMAGMGEVEAESGVGRTQAQENPSASSKVPAPGLSRAGTQPGGYLLVFRPSMISLNVEDGRITAFVFSSFGQ